MPEENAYPLNWIENARIEDGTLVEIRPIRSEDAPRLQEAFKLLSPQSIYMRFLEVFFEMSDEQAAYFASVDYTDRMALIATIQQGGKEQIVGVARYDQTGQKKPGAAECAVIVRDDYQGLGLGKRLMRRLIEYARQHGVERLIGTVLMGNNRMLSFIRESGLPYERELLEPGVWQVIVDISREI